MSEEFTRNPFTLANIADVASPDTNESPGAVFLLEIADAAEELVEDIRTGAVPWVESDLIHERADQLVPVYTAEVWRVFVDLAAYNEDDETGSMASYVESGAGGMVNAAMVALYQIAHRLLTALLEDVEENDEDDDEE